MNTLVIDTSTDIEFLAVSVKGQTWQYRNNSGMSHSVTMFQNLSSLLAQASIAITDINLIGTGIGPGSFTGIRIAVSTARMLAQILKVPLVGLKSHEIYAASVHSAGIETVLVAFDARKSKVFAGIYVLKDYRLHEIIEPGDYLMKDMLNSIKKPGDLICIGDGCGKYIDIIRDFSSEKKIKYNYIEDFLPEGNAAVELTLARYNESPDKYRDFNKIIPFYSRLSDAELLKK